MNYIPRRIIILLFLFVSHLSQGQDQAKTYFSEPIDLRKEGLNKVLCLRNGHTLLFHIEIGKPLTVAAFGPAHDRLAIHKATSRILDETLFRETLFKGLFEVNGQAILFFEQEHFSKHGLIRLCFNDSGTLTEEKRVVESPSISVHTSYIVVPGLAAKSYTIISSSFNPSFRKCDAHVSFYNEKHSLLKEFPVEVDQNKYDNVWITGAEMLPTGLCIVMGMSVHELNGTSNTIGQGTSDIFHFYLTAYFLPTDTPAFKQSKTIDLTTNVDPVLANFSYNPFAKSINVLGFSYRDAKVMNGLEWQPVEDVGHIFFRFDDPDMTIGTRWINNTMANDQIHKSSSKPFTGIPLSFFTNENGLSTVVMESYQRYYESRLRGNKSSYLGNFVVTQLDDDGKEIWGVALPKIQCFLSNTNFYPTSDPSRRKRSQMMFNQSTEEAYSRQFFSASTVSVNRNIYLIFNDEAANLLNTIEKPGDTVYSFGQANAVYYKIDRKREVTKEYLFGVPKPEESLSCFIEGSDIDQGRGVFATLVQCKDKEGLTFKMAWRKLD